jgi:hypothetical protein
MLENRIKRLAFEASRAQKVTDTVTLKAEKLLEARERHQREIEEKHRILEKKLMDEERQRIKNLSAKQQSIERRELTLQTVSLRNKQYKDYILSKEREGYQKRTENMQKELNDKRNQRDLINM